MSPPGAQRVRPEWEEWPPWEARLRRPRPPGCLTILSWNVAGLRGLLRRDPEAISRLVAAASPDVLCLQETKLQVHHEEEVARALDLPGWSSTWSSSTTRLGHAGVVTLSRRPPRSASCGLASLGERASGRLITQGCAGFTLVNSYSPNAGEGLKNLELRVTHFDAAVGEHMARLKGPRILAGDLNVAPQGEDVYDPERLGRLQAPGFSQAERESFVRAYTHRGLVDAFRLVHPRVRAYTFYSYRAQMRAKGRGWRLDHFLVSRDLVPAIQDCFILDHVHGSDHVPLGLTLWPSDKRSFDSPGFQPHIPAPTGLARPKGRQCLAAVQS